MLSSWNHHWTCLNIYLKISQITHSLTFSSLLFNIWQIQSWIGLGTFRHFLKSFHSRSFSSIVLFSFRSFTNSSIIFKNAFYAFVLFSERWDRSWSFRSFSWKNDRSPGTTPSPSHGGRYGRGAHFLRKEKKKINPPPYKFVSTPKIKSTPPKPWNYNIKIYGKIRPCFSTFLQNKIDVCVNFVNFQFHKYILKLYKIINDFE